VKIKNSKILAAVFCFSVSSAVFAQSGAQTGAQSGASVAAPEVAPSSAVNSEREPARSPSKASTANQKSAKTPKKSSSRQKPEVATPKIQGKIKALEVAGNKKIEKDAVLSRLVSKVGEPYSESSVRDDVLNLFKTGYFLDVSVDRKGQGDDTILTYNVVEKPSIVEIVYEGNTELKNEELGEASGIKAYEILNMAKVKESIEKIQKLYEDKGFFLAKIDPVVEEVKKDESVKLTYKIREGEKVKVKKITLLGNKNISDNAIKGKIFTQEEGYFSALSGSGAFKQDAFERDVQIIRQIYFNQGYVQVKIDRPQIYVTPDKKGIYVTIRIEEGNQYYVGEVDFSGDLLFTKEELFATTKIDDNEIFAGDVLQHDLADLQAKYGDLGYAYANVIPQWNFNEKERKVNIVFVIDKGNKVYFGKFVMVGNTRTRDKVIRREMKVVEGELYNETRRRQSLENIQRLGFFEDVNFKTSTPQDQLDVMNVDVVVKERNTGQVQLSAGYGSTTGMTFGGSVQQTNFLGRGQNLGVSAQLTSITSIYDFTFTEPYFDDTLWSLGFRAFMSEDNGRQDYATRKTGGSVSLGHPLTDEIHFTTTYGYTTSILSPIYQSGGGLLTDYDLFPLSTAEGDASTIGAAVDFDTRNDRFRPSKGWYARAAYNYTGLVGGNLHYYRSDATLRYFKTIFWDVVFRNSLTYGKIGSLDDRNPPFNELFLLGGPYSLRGYRYARVGRMVKSSMVYSEYLKQNPGKFADAEAASHRFYGGNQQVQYQGELQFPLIREADMYGVAFYDIGEAQDELSTGDDTFGSSKIKADWGFGIRWFSPIGPLRFEWGFPLNRDPLYHEPVVFEFSIGTPF
jgi:outer membrane protein insertion porin family